jgi:hypothetical protein
VRYHVLVPVEDAATRVETAMGSLASGELMTSPAMMVPPRDVEGLQHELLETCRGDLKASLAALHAAGAQAVGDTVSIDPVEALRDKVAEVDAREAIILTRPHVVAEFFHVDWTARARRKLQVPVLHLLEHENFDEQAGGGEGVSGV